MFYKYFQDCKQNLRNMKQESLQTFLPSFSRKLSSPPILPKGENFQHTENQCVIKF